MLPLLIAIPPVVALGAMATWLVRPDLRREPMLRGALIVSVCVAGAEALVGVLGLGFLWLLSNSNVDF